MHIPNGCSKLKDHFERSAYHMSQVELKGCQESRGEDTQPTQSFIPEIIQILYDLSPRDVMIVYRFVHSIHTK